MNGSAPPVSRALVPPVWVRMALAAVPMAAAHTGTRTVAAIRAVLVPVTVPAATRAAMARAGTVPVARAAHTTPTSPAPHAVLSRPPRILMARQATGWRRPPRR
ncbi:MAG: hypothetical protein E6713_20055 [Sporomusaceae bacterium]|nr:hypothetical protein [Sporomusaceae bacterium]